MLYSITGFKQLMADDDVINMGCSRCWGAVDSETKNCKSCNGPRKPASVKSCHTRPNISIVKKK